MPSKKPSIPSSGRDTKPFLMAWLPLICSPFLFGTVIWIFPIDRALILTVALSTLGVIALAGALPWLKHRHAALFAGVAMIGLILSMPFWALALKNDPQAAPVEPVFSYKVAKSNPQAFTKWWNFFVSEVVRVNEIVFVLDANSPPDAQGKRPRLPVPGARASFYKGEVVINNQGYRGDNFSREKENLYRILTIGDSATFGQTLFADSRTWSAVLQELISRNLRCAKPVQVVNGGVNGHYLRNGIDRVKRDYAWLKPDMVLSYFGWNSTTSLGFEPVAEIVAAPPQDANRSTVVFWFIKNAFNSLKKETAVSYERFVSLFKREEKLEVKMAKVRAGELYGQYHELMEHARHTGYQLAFLSFNTALAADSPAGAKDFYRGAWPGVTSIVEQIHLHNLMIEELARTTNNARFVDTSADLYGKYDGDIYLDIVHFTPRGDAIMADNVYRGILPLLVNDKELECRPQ